MMPTPDELARLVDRAEAEASAFAVVLPRFDAATRRRYLAEAVLRALRNDGDPVADPQPVPVSPR